MTLSVVIFLSLLASAPPGATTPTPEELEQAVLTQRRRVVQGEVELKSRLWKIKGTERVFRHERITHIWFDENNIRGDFTFGEKGSDHLNDKATRLVKCFSPNRFIYWDEGRTVVSIAGQGRLPPRNTNAPPNPRLIGIAPIDSANVVYFTLTSFLQRPDRTHPIVSGATLRDTICWKLQYTMADGLVVSTWIAPEAGYSVLRMETQGSDESNRYVDTIDTSYTMLDRDVWFPATCSYRRQINGVTTDEELLTMTPIQVNKPLAPGVFDLEGMGIIPGTHVQYDPAPSKAQLRWDGHTVVPIPLEELLLSMRKEPQASRRSTFLMGLSFALAATGALGILVYLTWGQRARSVPGLPRENT